MNKTVRNSGIEILRIVGMFLICVHHFTYSNNLENFTHPACLYDICHVFFTYFGSVGNSLFAITSAYFLVESDKVRISKIFDIIIKQSIITVCVTLGFIAFGNSISIAEFIRNSFTIFFGMHWFIRSYIIYYLIHGCINKILNDFSKQQLKIICIFIIAFYFILPLYWRISFPQGAVSSFVFIHCILYYNKKFMIDYNSNIILNIKMLFTSVALWVISIFFLILISNTTKLNLVFISASMINPLYIIAFISLINILGSFNMRNKVINYIASLTMMIYIIHENSHIQTYIRTDMWKYFIDNYSKNECLVIGMAISIFGFIISMVLASIFSIFNPAISKVSIYLEERFYKICQL